MGVLPMDMSEQLGTTVLLPGPLRLVWWFIYYLLVSSEIITCSVQLESLEAFYDYIIYWGIERTT
jgi:hypothetical protein